MSFYPLTSSIFPNVKNGFISINDSIAYESE